MTLADDLKAAKAAYHWGGNLATAINRATDSNIERGWACVTVLRKHLPETHGKSVFGFAATKSKSEVWHLFDMAIAAAEEPADAPR